MNSFIDTYFNDFKSVLEKFLEIDENKVNLNKCIEVLKYTKVDNKDIPLSICFVTSFYYNGEWKNLKKPQMFVPYINRLGKLFDNEKCRF